MSSMAFGAKGLGESIARSKSLDEHRSIDLSTPEIGAPSGFDRSDLQKEAATPAPRSINDRMLVNPRLPGGPIKDSSSNSDDLAQRGSQSGSGASPLTPDKNVGWVVIDKQRFTDTRQSDEDRQRTKESGNRDSDRQTGVGDQQVKERTSGGRGINYNDGRVKELERRINEITRDSGSSPAPEGDKVLDRHHERHNGLNWDERMIIKRIGDRLLDKHFPERDRDPSHFPVKKETPNLDGRLADTIKDIKSEITLKDVDDFVTARENANKGKRRAVSGANGVDSESAQSIEAQETLIREVEIYLDKVVTRDRVPSAVPQNNMVSNREELTEMEKRIAQQAANQIISKHFPEFDFNSFRHKFGHRSHAAPTPPTSERLSEAGRSIDKEVSLAIYEELVNKGSMNPRIIDISRFTPEKIAKHDAELKEAFAAKEKISREVERIMEQTFSKAQGGKLAS